MRKAFLKRGFLVFGLLAVGYICGSAHMLSPGRLHAQLEGEPAEGTRDRIRAAYSAMGLAMADLQTEQRYTSATKGINTFAVTVGGIDALKDLEDGRGVDPITFAALYADQATEEIKPHLSLNGSGELMYKNSVVRLYSKGRLKKLFAERLKFTAVGL